MSAAPADLPPATRLMRERRIEAGDGTELFFRHAVPAHGAPKGGVVLLHRGHEHGGRAMHVAEESGLDAFAFYAPDQRGHGRSRGARGDAPDVATLAADLERLVRHIEEVDGIAAHDIAVVGQSFGALVAATWVHDYAPRLRALVLAAPAFDIDLRVPGAALALKAWHRIRGDYRVRSVVTPAELTADEGRAASYETDPLIVRPISARLLLDAGDVAARIVADASAIHCPVQMLIPGADRVVRRGAQDRFFDGLGSARKERRAFEGLRHDILGERDRAPVMDALRGFVEEAFATPAAVPDLTRSDREGPSFEEAQALRRPAIGLARLRWGVAKAGLRAGAALSEGLALGHRTGFDSGSTLDYVYRNEARGRTPLGRMIDRQYLDAIGWRGIRQRKRNMEAVLAEATARLREQDRAVRIVDIAAGHGRYVLDAIAAAGAMPDAVLLRDYDEANVAAGRALIAERGLEGVARFERGDAFDRESLASLDPAPTLAIISGLYELFEGNEGVAASLAGLAEAMEEGALLAYTNQPWHPQLEVIARTLTSHRGGDAWVMRRRSQAEMDQLVARAGFEKLGQRIDRWGIFSVSLAVRRH